MGIPATADARLRAERARVADVADRFSTETGLNARVIDYRFEAIAPFLADARSCLELGCSDGRMTGPLSRLVDRVVAVDGSEKYVEVVRERFPHVTAVHALFEELELDERFDVVVLAHVLEHVDDPRLVLARAARFAADGGRVIVTVPNADSLHRQAAVLMGLLPAVNALNETDVRIGHRRVYTRGELLADVRATGLVPVHVGGVFLKPLANAQIEREWSPEQIDAFAELGRRHPDLAAELVVVAVADGETE